MIGEVGRPEGRSLGRPRVVWEGNIKMDHQEGWDGMDWIALAYEREMCEALMKAVMNLRVP